jgi:hypothetical protein
MLLPISLRLLPVIHRPKGLQLNLWESQVVIPLESDDFQFLEIPI